MSTTTLLDSVDVSSDDIKNFKLGKKIKFVIPRSKNKRIPKDMTITACAGKLIDPVDVVVASVKCYSKRIVYYLVAA